MSPTSRKGADQSGFALPTMLIAMIAVMGVLSVGAVAAISTQRGTVRDVNTKAALAVAETGANIALLRYNRAVKDPIFHLDATEAPCVVVDGSPTGQPVPGVPLSGGTWDGWCPREWGSSGEGEYSYWVKSPVESDNPAEWKIEIIARGQIFGPDGEVSAVRVIRLEADAAMEFERDEEEPADEDPNPPGAYLGAENMVGIDWLAVSGNSPIYSNAGSNGQVIIKDSARICGNVRMGPGTPPPVGPHMAHWMDPPEANYSNGQGGGICYTKGEPEYELGEGVREYYPVKLPDGLTTENDATNRFFTEDGKDLPEWYIGTPELRRQRWNPETRTLKIDAGLTLRLKADYPYFLCRLELAGGATIIADATEPVQIFFDKPENCPDLPPMEGYRDSWIPDTNWRPGTKQQLEIANGTMFLSNGHVPGLYFLGSDTIPTGIIMAGGSENHQMVVYAPKTDISISGDFTFRGAMVGKTLQLSGGSRANAPFDGEEYPIPVEPPEEADPPDDDPPEQTGTYRPTSFSDLVFSECEAKSAIDPSSLSCG